MKRRTTTSPTSIWSWRASSRSTRRSSRVAAGMGERGAIHAPRGGWCGVLLFLLALTVAVPAAAGWRAQGTAAYRRGDLAGALAAYTRAAADTPDDPVLWNNVAVVLWRLGAVETATRAASEAVSLRPAYAEAERNRRLFATFGGDGVAPHDQRVRFLAALLARRARARTVADSTSVAAPAPAVRAESAPPLGVVAAGVAPPPVAAVASRAAERPPAAVAHPAPRPRNRRATRVAARGPAPAHATAASAVAVVSPPAAVAPSAAAGSTGGAAIGAAGAEASGGGGRVPAAVLRLEPGAAEVLLVDKATHHLYLLRGSAEGPVVVARVPCVVGKRPGRKARRGDLRTPEGVYFLERKLDGGRLPELYGAMAYPTDYPNSFDHLDGREGGGIWLHGTGDASRLASRDDSRGCVVVDNPDLERLAASIETRRTPMVVVPEIVWLTPAAARARADALIAWLDGWRQEWQAGSWERYRGRYADAFFRLGHIRDERWLADKRAFLAAEGERRIAVGEITLLAAAGQTVAVFNQGYDSPRRRDRGVKRVYLTGAGTGYRIVAEQWIQAPQSAAHLASRTGASAPRS
ncbi:MAG: hypothetical protein COZ96_01315 [Nitrospirae bacterium CG_4_8_14_3_um_filter_70_85]|nr:MAG: hypothetical protein COZ96_01315 [Nitrospirae bacterium CG_4_8_14_3_um_filter_70_85]PIX82224.1 MAG: hypothetical protein COZ33_11985 [Nitrospirae bacterium CG_4_10_14_3_um_filter_70_108]